VLFKQPQGLKSPRWLERARDGVPRLIASNWAMAGLNSGRSSVPLKIQSKWRKLKHQVGARPTWCSNMASKARSKASGAVSTAIGTARAARMAESQVPYPYDAARVTSLKASLLEPRFAAYLAKGNENEPFAFALPFATPFDRDAAVQLTSLNDA
jgi:hypothetical protein